MPDSRRTAPLAALALALALLAASASLASTHTVSGSASTIRAPKSGEYRHVNASLYVNGKELELVALRFACSSPGAPSFAATNLNGVPLKRSSVGYRFAIKASGSVSYSDGYPDENARIGFSGRFSKSGKRAIGRFRVKPPRCGDTGEVQFSARRP